MGAEHSRRHHQAETVPDNFSSSLQNSDLTQRKKHQRMDRLRRTLSFRSRRKENLSNNNNSNTLPNKNDKSLNSTNENKPSQWQDDEKAVRMDTCSFNVKYLGSVEVQESRGMYVCEQAIQALLNQKVKHIKAVLHISCDALRVVDQTNKKGLIVDQTIEKVSFCAPDHRHEKGFAYICRDGTTRRWLCHCFLATKETGERLSHAVGCAFQVCLERKQKRDSECNVTVEYTQNGTSFTKFGSFRTTSIAERIIDPQSAIVVEPIPYTSTIISSNQKNNAIERPRPKGHSSDAFIRSASMRLDNPNQAVINSFKRQNSLRPSDLPSIQESKYKDSIPTTIPEEVESASSINELSKLSLYDSTNTSTHNHFPLPITKSSIIPLSSSVKNENISSNIWPTNPLSIIPEQSRQANTTTTSINDAFDSNLSALVQSNHPINPFSPYGYSVAAQAQSSNGNRQQLPIFTPKRGSNPFDDDLIRR
ncbi:unnamed protein product [Rotaria socialis]|uniref:PID domain-containing protein n=1 Tax=Rotaria socialis TaxID=392032 RepID=A0A818A2W8_9BILA|nr:unnamed protein product [Rotaria socialis]CAF3399429.1 unnamed protein product [Rotaria socialis]CAF3637258.1 unnamed protein product [Rotaria socialis]CAF3659637.1 unnamed protein product [Rotaria socialis]CAF4237094.1 unnamed protein product [Rotaria socialis]